MDEHSRNKAISTLQKIPVFAGLQISEYHQLLGICSVSHYRIGDVIFKEKEPSKAMYIQLSGETELQTSTNGHVYVMKSGDLFGEIGVICQENRTATAIISDAAVIMELDKDKFDFLQGKNPLMMAKILRNVTKVLAGRLLSSGQHSYIM